MKKLTSIVILMCVFFLEETHMCSGGNSTSGCLEGEREALLELRRSFEDPSNRLASWSSEDCCVWSGVNCDTRNGHVVQLDLGTLSEPLSAPWIDSSLTELKRLEYLDLSGNDFRGSRIPEFFGSFKYLTYLNISWARFGGTIPRQLGNLTSLKVADLSYNFVLYVDDFRWASSLSSLQNLRTSYVNLGKALDLIPTLSKLPSLLQLQLDHCGIQNVHFSVWPVNSTFLTTLQSLDLTSNELSGPIPKAIQNMTALRRLELSSQSGSILSGGLHSDNTQWASSLLSLQYLGMSLVNFSKATDLIQVLNTLPSLLHLGLSACGIQSIHFSHVALNSTLSKLQYLDLSSNRISGPVPDVLKNMTDLRELDLSSNKFNSTAPLWSVDSKSLVSLDIGYNQFDKIEAPLSSMLSNACSLKSLNLLENPFGSLMFGSKLNSSRCLSYSLESLNIQNTEATGNIPDWLGKFKSLKDLNLGQNLLSGPVPPSIIQLPLLGSLDLSINRLTGEIPGSLTRLPALKSLDLSNNLLTGEIPRSFGSHFPVLERLDLSYNRLNGTIPHALGGLSTLQYLYLAHNTLNGLIPWSLERLSNLKQLVLLNNKLSGPVFQSMGQIASLEALDISSNPLEGVISELHFANLTELKYLIISSTNLTWDVESNWVPPFSLHTLNMSSGGTRLIFPHWLRTQKDIHEIDFSKARIRGSFPRWFRAENLEYMDLSMNQISGESLAQIFEAAPKIQILLLGNNSMIGPISNSLCTLENLFILDVSGNKISGELPNCFTGLSRFLIINLSGNRLSGKIPNSLGNLQFLYRFHVNQNYLDGVIPLSLGNCTYLEVLDLGENRFSGSIPSWIGEKLSSLRILRLRKNMLNGTIPPQLCKLSNLQILDLAQNYLAGEIPHCIGNLTGMTTHTTTEVFTYTSIYAPRQGFFLDYFDGEWYRVRILESTKGLNHLEYTRMPLQLLNLLDLSSNKLVGVIPKEICLLNGLKSLTLSHNNLSGNIPEMVGNLKLLDTLDLSYNKLSGEIPRSMSALSSISQLNFSYNNLSGRIPTGNQLQTLIDPSIYSGNILLCGAPLRKSCPDDDDHSIQQKTDKDHEDETKEKIVFWCVVIAGYATGFLAVIGTLIFNRGRGGSNIFSLLRKFMR